MRLFALVAVVLALSSSPVQSGCPDLTPEQLARVSRSDGAASSAAVTAISISALQPYCARSTSLLCKGGAGRKLTISEVRSVDWALRTKFQYRDDFVRTGRGDLWQDNVTCGDCEDYALSLAEALHRAGGGGRHMRLTMWSPFAGAAHATLIVDTANAGAIEIGVGTNETPHTYTASGVRFASMRFDGRRAWKAEPGYRITSTNVEFMLR